MPKSFRGTGFKQLAVKQSHEFPRGFALHTPQSRYKIFDAARNNQTAVIARYLNQKGDPNKRDDRGHSLLILAAYNGSLESVDLLLKRGADTHLQDGMGTALMAASVKSFRPIVQRLLDAGARVDERNGIGATALMFAALTGKLSVVSLLMDSKADTSARDQRGLDAKRLAEQQGNTEMLGLLETAPKTR